MAATQKDIANRLNLSQSVVAGVLTNSPSKRANAETRQRVLDAAREMGYAPNAAARMLRSGKSQTVVLACVRQRFAGPDAAASTSISEQLGQHGYRLEVKTSASSEILLAMLDEMARSGAADAFLLWGLEPEVEEQGLLLESLGQPFVARGYYDRHPHWCQIDFDHRGMMYRTVDKLIEFGHERIAFLNHDNDQVYAVNYRRAFEDAIRNRLGRSTPESWMLHNDETRAAAVRILSTIKQWFRQPAEQRPTAIAAGESGSAVSTVELGLLAHGVRIGDEPGRFAIAGVSLDSPGRILTGPTWVYEAGGEVEIATRLMANQLMPLLGHQEPVERIIRYSSSLLRHTPDLDIWSTGAISINPGWPPANE